MDLKSAQKNESEALGWWVNNYLGLSRL